MKKLFILFLLISCGPQYVQDPNAPAGFMQGGMVQNIGGGQVNAQGVYTPQ